MYIAIYYMTSMLVTFTRMLFEVQIVLLCGTSMTEFNLIGSKYRLVMVEWTIKMYAT